MDDERQERYRVACHDSSYGDERTYELNLSGESKFQDLFEKLCIGREQDTVEEFHARYEVRVGSPEGSVVFPKWSSCLISECLEPSSVVYILPISKSSDDSDDRVPQGPARPSITDGATSDEFPAPAPPPMPSSSTKIGVTGLSSWSSATSSATSWDKRSESGFVGLANQGATCYMNSLVQSMFMTPEFRRAVYLWDFEERFRRDLQEFQRRSLVKDAEEKAVKEGEVGEEQPKTEEEFREKRRELSIPLQLQRLFLRLQTSEKRCVKTTKLTKSFGWNGMQAFEQHDVQELCRVLFDALEESMAGTAQANMINSLFQGKMTDYVQCTVCGKLSARQDDYLDIPLVLKTFEGGTLVHSVEEALCKFVQPEILDGDDGYACEKCGKKVKAIKGLQFLSFPPILTLQLKRFDFDYNTGRRVKLNHRVSFPRVFDLNVLLDQNNAASSSGSSQTQESTQDSPMEDATTTVATGAPAPPPPPPVPTAERPYVYELYAVLIHSGSAMGGHYYSYVRALGPHDNKNDGKWFQFNDSSVSELNDADVDATFGNEESSELSYSWSGGSNAYMLLYRRLPIPPAESIKLPVDDEIPEHLQEMAAEDKARSAANAEKKRRERDTLDLRCHYRGEEKKFLLHKETKVIDAVAAALKLFEVDGVDPADARLRMYSPTTELVAEPLSSADEATLASNSVFSYRSVVLETREHGQDFPPFDPNKFEMKVSARWSSEEFSRKPVPFPKSSTVGDVRQAIAEALGIKPERTRLLLERSYCYCGLPFINLTDDLRIYCSAYGNYDGFKIWAEEFEDAHSEDTTGSRAAEELFNIKAKIAVKVNLLRQPAAASSASATKTWDLVSDSVVVDKRSKLGEFKQTVLAPLVKLDPSEMRVSRGSTYWQTELKDLSKSLDDLFVSDSSELFVEKGHPLLADETAVQVVLYRPEFLDVPASSKPPPVLEAVFEIPLSESMNVRSAKEEIARRLAESRPELKMSADAMRIRDTISAAAMPSRVLMDDEDFRSRADFLLGKYLCVQRTPTVPDLVQSTGHTVVLTQLWHPSTLVLEQRTELVLPPGATPKELTELISAKTGIAVDCVECSRHYSNADGVTPLAAATDKWDIRVDTPGLLKDSPFFFRDSELVLYRDKTEPVKELSIQERQKLEKESAALSHQRYASSYVRKETALKIRHDK